MKNTIQENLKQYLLKNTKGNHELDDETIQKIISDSIIYYDYDKYSKEELNNMTLDEFSEFLEFDLCINVFETYFDYLAWSYEDESVYRVLQDLSQCKDIDTLAQNQFNDDTYQFKNGLIINLMI